MMMMSFGFFLGFKCGVVKEKRSQEGGFDTAPYWENLISFPSFPSTTNTTTDYYGALDSLKPVLFRCREFRVG